MPTSTSQERQTKRAPGEATEAKGANAAAAAATSTLIEFPGVPPKPQWRKELSERVREIQQRRALEAAREAEVSAPQPNGHMPADMLDDPTADMVSGATAETSAPPLGLVPPPPDAPQPNPLVVAALKRIERARQSNPPPVARASRGGAATAAAVAHVAEENYQAAPETELIHGHAVTLDEQAGQATIAEEVERPVETARSAPPLAIVPPAAAAPKTSDASATQTRARRHIPVVADEASLSQLEAQMHAALISNHTETPDKSVSADDQAPVSKRIAGGIVDLIVVGFASTPFAAIIELTSGNWADARVAASMGGIVVVLMFVYLMAATALAGRTWGMSLVSLRTVDAQTGMAPTTGQCIRRAVGYLLSLATLGLGLLYALFDAEGRAAHDHLSGTIVIAD
ncbi:MAG TPA: RDD family protein [Pyrinomonadaceae bacterium]|nr:RDD family protein [Pyrinomonadaceae bacterium]